MGHAEHGHWKRLGDGSLLTQDPDEGLGHVVSISMYNKVYGTLLFLTVITVLAATQDFGPLAIAIAILIATFKAAAVGLYFMHLRWESRLIQIVATYPLIIFLLMVLGTLGDAAVKRKILPLTSSQQAVSVVAATISAPSNHHQ